MIFIKVLKLVNEWGVPFRSPLFVHKENENATFVECRKSGLLLEYNLKNEKEEATYLEIEKDVKRINEIRDEELAKELRKIAVERHKIKKEELNTLNRSHNTVATSNTTECLTDKDCAECGNCVNGNCVPSNSLDCSQTNYATFPHPFGGLLGNHSPFVVYDPTRYVVPKPMDIKTVLTSKIRKLNSLTGVPLVGQKFTVDVYGENVTYTCTGHKKGVVQGEAVIDGHSITVTKDAIKEMLL